MQTGRTQSLSKGAFLRGALYFFITFALVITTNLPFFPGSTRSAYASETEPGTLLSLEGEEGEPGGEPGGEEPPPVVTIPKITDVGIFYSGTGVALGYSNNSTGEIGRAHV